MAEEILNLSHCYENLIVVDVGANLINKKYMRDLESVIQRAKDSGKYHDIWTVCLPYSPT